MANNYKLSGHGIELDYTIGGSPSLPALTLIDNGITRTYLPPDITIDMTDLGTIVSVPLTAPGQAGAVRFGFFLPAVKAPPGQRVAVTTSGIVQTCGGSDAAHRSASWSCVHLHGTASQVGVRARAPVAA